MYNLFHFTVLSLLTVLSSLDSRHRKKAHTEKLEGEKKQLNRLINNLQGALDEMKIREAEMVRDKHEWFSIQQQYQNYTDGLHMEKNELIRVHTLETAELRRKNNILKEMVEKMEREPKAATMGTDDFSEFESFALDSDAYDEFGIPRHFSFDAAEPAPISTTNERALQKNSTNSEYPFSWNAFYMCLLFGAFIASNSSTLSSRAIPDLSEEYRTESANVLKAVLSSSPAELTTPTNQAQAPIVAPSTSASTGVTNTISGIEMQQMSTGNPSTTTTLDELHNTLTLPTKEQEQEQAFTMTPDQYNSLTTYDDGNDPENQRQQQQPSNLQQALNAMRNDAAAAQDRVHNNNKKSSSDIYSRSLMWDHVPKKVIHDFRRMVQEYGAGPIKEEGS